MSIVVDGRSEPSTGIRDGKERGSGGIDDHLRIAAEEARISEKIEPASIGQLAEFLVIGIVAIEVDGNGGDLDGDRPVGRRGRLVGKRRYRRADDSSEESCGGTPGCAAQQPHANGASGASREPPM